MERFQPGFSSNRRYVVLILLVILSGAMLGCASNRAKEMSRGGVTVSYREGGEITIRTARVVVRLSPAHALSMSLLQDGQELSLNFSRPEANEVPSDYVTANRSEF